MALTFNGDVANYAQVAIPFSASKGTVCAWVRIDTDRNAYSTFFQTNATDGQQFLLQTAADGTTLSCYIFDTTVTGSNLNVGQWYHLTLNWNGTAAKVYVNGVLDITVNGTGSTWNEIELGRSYWGEPLNGNIAYVKAWDATLSLGQIALEVNSAAAIKTSNLVGQWLTPAGAGRGADSSGNNKNFTLNGTITDYSNPSLGATHGRWLRTPGSSFL